MLASGRDYYRILGVDHHADQAAIKRAYRRLALQYHPDVAQHKRSPTRFLEIREAYAVLSDPEKRWQYDSLRPYSRQATSPSARRPRAKRVYPRRPRSGLLRLVVKGSGLSIGFSLGSLDSS